MEQDIVAMRDGADAVDGTPDEQLKDLVESATIFRESAQKAYEGKKAITEAIQAEIKAQEENITRLTLQRENASVGRQEWAVWQGDGGKIFS